MRIEPPFEKDEPPFEKDGCSSLNLLEMHMNSAEPKEIARIPCKRKRMMLMYVIVHVKSIPSIRLQTVLPNIASSQISTKLICLKLRGHQIPNSVEPSRTCTPSTPPCTKIKAVNLLNVQKHYVACNTTHAAHTRHTNFTATQIAWPRMEKLVMLKNGHNCRRK